VSLIRMKCDKAELLLTEGKRNLSSREAAFRSGSTLPLSVINLVFIQAAGLEQSTHIHLKRPDILYGTDQRIGHIFPYMFV